MKSKPVSQTTDEILNKISFLVFWFPIKIKWLNNFQCKGNKLYITQFKEFKFFNLIHFIMHIFFIIVA